MTSARRTRLLWKLVPSYLLLMLATVLALAWASAAALRHFEVQKTDTDLEVLARFIGARIINEAGTGPTAEIDEQCKSYGRALRVRVTVMLPSGVVVGESDTSPARMENHAARPEMAAALAGTIRADTRRSNTLAEDMRYVAVPVRREGRIVAVVRTALPLTILDAALRDSLHRLLLGVALIFLVTSVVGVLFARRLARPLESLTESVRHYARGEGGRQLPASAPREVADLSDALRDMAEQLDSRMRAAFRQRHELEAVLISMTEGVLAVDAEQRIMKLNAAAARLLGIDIETAEGRPVSDVVRNAELREFIARVLDKHEAREGEIVLRDAGIRYMQTQSTVLRNEEHHAIGALVVMTDVTRLRRLEQVRRDFVANVSHELKTPITSIKGFVETLQDGALHSREDAERFLAIIARHADRLNAIIEDLLELARIEESGATDISREPTRIRALLTVAIQTCEARAFEKAISITLDCPDGLTATVSPALLEQAVVNLVDNAVKYSEAGKPVDVSAILEGDTLVLRVHDRGPGIPAAHLSRLFERFYRVDKGRSRQLGGTGLGLAIVKHIAQAHGGDVTVASRPGEGSTFTVRLPRS
jgi:two-component system, OmpR family, phosphate regulon sensor histidine kinase PhoR